MKTQIVLKFFEDVLSCEPEKLEVLRFLKDTQQDNFECITEDALISFIEYYGFDVDQLNEQIDERAMLNGYF